MGYLYDPNFLPYRVKIHQKAHKLIDYITMKIKVAHRTPSYKKGSEIDLFTGEYTEWLKKADLEGSHSSHVTVWSQDRLPMGEQGEARKPRDTQPRENNPDLYQYLWIRGNPQKFLYGQNLYGTDNKALISAFVMSVCGKLGIEIHPEQIEWAKITRVDITYGLMLETIQQAKNYMGVLGRTSAARTGPPRLYENGNIHFMPFGTLWQLLIYHKGDEMRRHKLPESISEATRERLQSDADRTVRFELRLKREQLKRKNMATVHDLFERGVKKTFTEFVSEKISYTTNMKVTDEHIAKMKSHLQASFFLWKQGENLKQLYGNNKYYQHRRALKKIGIDIAIPYTVQQADIVPIHKTIRAKEAKTPQWVMDEGLVHAG